MLLCAKLGVHFRCATPEGYAPQPEFVQKAQTEGEVDVLRDPVAAVRDADAVTPTCGLRWDRKKRTRRDWKFFRLIR
jgi:ornithine carbamoyltransferase